MSPRHSRHGRHAASICGAAPLLLAWASTGNALICWCAQASDGSGALQQEPGGLEEEEDEPQGVEMEDDFEGELQDVPEAGQQEGDEEEAEEDDEQRLEQQMGEGGEGEQVGMAVCCSVDSRHQRLQG